MKWKFRKGQVPTTDTVTPGSPAGLRDPLGYSTYVLPANDKTIWPVDYSEPNPLLTWPNNLSVLAEMAVDPQITANNRALHTMLLGVDWRIDPAGAEDEFVQTLSTDFGLPIIGVEAADTPNAVRVPFYAHLAEALECTTWGHKSFEISVDVTGPIVRIRGLDPRQPLTITQMPVDSQGVLQEIVQFGNLVIPGNRVLHYSVGAPRGVPWGRSMLRSAYGPWRMKSRLERVLVISAERNGMGIPIAEMDKEATEEQVAEALKIAEAMRVGEAAGAAIVNGTIRLRGVEGQVHNTLDDIKYMNGQISKSMLETFLELGLASTGSHALGEVQIDLFQNSGNALANEIAEMFTNQVFKRLAQWTYGVDAKVPRLVPGKIGRDNDLAPQMLSMLMQGGAITPTRGTEVYLRQLYGLPALEPDEGHQDRGSAGASIKFVKPPPEHEGDPGAENF